jgi:hypothetical protein
MYTAKASRNNIATMYTAVASRYTTIATWYNASASRCTAVRVRRSYSLKAKISENVGIFVLALKRKKCFFSLCSHASEKLQTAKKIKRKESEAKREAKNYNSSKSLKVSL